LTEKLKIWESDCLNRKDEGKFLIHYLLKRYEQNKEKPFVLNLNAEWGFGKTYFLENLKLELEEKHHPVVYFDAWKNDYTKDPLLAFISEVDNSLKEYFKVDSKTYKVFKGAIKSIAPKLLSSVSKKLVGVSLDELEEVIEDEKISKEIEDNSEMIEKSASTFVLKSAENALKNHQVIKKSIGSFKSNMTLLLDEISKVEDKKLPLFILIDELDRCRPSYAIELLENIKHLFDIKSIIFIVATDSKQLSHSINAIYGNEFESQRYLKRFFDQEYTLRTPDSYEYSYYLFEQYGLLNNELLYSPLEEEYYKDKNLEVQLFSLYADFFKLVPRDINQVMIVLSAIILTWEGKESIHLGYMLFLIMLKQKDDNLFLEYEKEENKITLVEKMISNDSLKKDVKLMFTTGKGIEKNLSISYLIGEYIGLENIKLEKLISTDTYLKPIIIRRIYGVLESDMATIPGFIQFQYKRNQKLKESEKLFFLKLKLYSEIVLRSGQFTV